MPLGLMSRSYVLLSTGRNQTPRLIYYLVPFLSFISIVITEAFHVFYSDQTELVSVILPWSNWVNPKNIRWRISCQICFTQGNVSDVQCKMFSTRQCFSPTYHESYFTCAWAGNACLLFSIITVFTRADRLLWLLSYRGFCGLAFSRSLRAALAAAFHCLVFYLSRSLRF